MVGSTVRNTSSSITMIQKQQKKRDTTGGGRKPEGFSSMPIRCVSDASSKERSWQLQSLTISFRTAVTRNSSGIAVTGRLFVSPVMIAKP